MRGFPIFRLHDQSQSARRANGDYCVAIDGLIGRLCPRFPEYAVDSDKSFRVEPVLRRRFDAYKFLDSCLRIVCVSVTDQREDGYVF